MSATTLVHRLGPALRWRRDALRERIRERRSDPLADRVRCRVELGFALPPLGTMQNYRRMKFLHDCVVRFAPPTGVALEVGCYKCSSTVFIAKACERKKVAKVYALDLFTGTPSWNLTIDYFDTARKRIDQYGLRDMVTLIRSNSLDYEWTQPIAAMHIDADHEYEAVWNDIRKYTPYLVKNGIVVFDDYDVSHPGVTRAVHRLLAEDSRFEVAAANYQGVEFGSVCLRRVGD